VYKALNKSTALFHFYFYINRVRVVKGNVNVWRVLTAVRCPWGTWGWVWRGSEPGPGMTTWTCRIYRPLHTCPRTLNQVQRRRLGTLSAVDTVKQHAAFYARRFLLTMIW